MDYGNKDELLTQAQTYLDAEHGSVSIDADALDRAAASFQMPERLPDWKDYISAQAQEPYDLTRAAFEFALNASQNAGYTEPSPEGVTKWEIKGSGSSALKAFFREMRDKNRLPGIDLDEAGLQEHIAPMLDGDVITPDLRGRKVPFAAQRLEMFKEFAKPGAMKVFADIMAAAKTETGYISPLKIRCCPCASISRSRSVPTPCVKKRC